MTQFNRGLKGLRKEHFSESDIFHLHVKYHNYHANMHDNIIYFKPNNTTPYVQINGVETELSALIGAGLYKGVLDASAGIPYPAAQVGEFWRISVAGSIGTTFVEVGDQVICVEAYAGGMDDTKFMIIQTTTQITDVTYAQLQTLITNATLETGRQYRITDYATAYNIFDGGTNAVIEAQLGTAEPLIVLATGEATLAKEAYSELYPQDIIYYNPLVNAVDRAAFIVAGDIGYVTTGSLVAGFKGIIEYRHDTKQNVSTWYDFRNIKFRRWAVDCAVYDAGTAYTAKDVLKGSDGKIYKCISDVIAGQGDPSTNTVNWILWNDITADAYISWTADSSMFAIGGITTPNNLIFDTATYQDVYTFGDWYRHVNSVTIGKNELAILLINGVYTTLNNIVFKTQDNAYTCFSNEIGQISYNNTIGNQFYSNTIDNGFYSNTIGNGFYSNTIGNEFNANTIDNRFSFNTIGNQFYSNTIGNEFNANTIDNRFSFNTIGNNFYFNTIGNNFSFNTIGNGFSFNTIGNGFSFNTIGNGFYSNTIGNNSKVSAGINCQGNSIGDYNTQVTLGDNCTNLTFQNGCTFNTNTAVTGLQNCLFESGTSITGVDFTLATHIKATYNKRVFTNASSVVRLSYFNAADTLTVVNVND